MVIFCDFDNAMNGPDGLNSGCPGIEFSVGNADFDVATTSDSADTGPTADHTGNGGKSSNETGSRGETTAIAVWRKCSTQLNIGFNFLL